MWSVSSSHWTRSWKSQISAKRWASGSVGQRRAASDRVPRVRTWLRGKDRCPNSSCGVVARTGGRGSCGPASPAAGGGTARTAAQDRHLQGGQLHQPQHARRSHGRAGRDRFHPWTAALTQALASVAISALGTFAFNLPFSVPAPMLLESAASTVFASMAVAASVAWRDASQPIGGASLRVAEQHEADRRIGG